MKNYSILILSILILFPCCSSPKQSRQTAYIFHDDGSIVEPTGRRLKTIVAEKYPEGNLLIGGTTGSWALEDKAP